MPYANPLLFDKKHQNRKQVTYRHRMESCAYRSQIAIIFLG